MTKSLISCIRKSSFFILTCFLIQFFSWPFTAYAQQNSTITIGLSLLNEETLAASSVFTDYLESRLPEHQFALRNYSSPEELLVAVRQKEMDFAILFPATFVELNLDTPVRVLSTLTQEAGDTYSPWLAGAIFTLDSRDDIATLSDVKGTRVAKMSDLTLGGWLAAAREWQGIGIDVESDFETQDFMFSYGDVIDSVCSGDADIGVLHARYFWSLASRCDKPLKILSTPEFNQNILYPIPRSTRLYPEMALAMISANDEEFIRNFTRAVLDIQPGSSLVSSFYFQGFTAPLQYTEVQALMTELRLGPFEGMGSITLQELVANNIYLITFILVVILLLITAGFLHTQRLSRKFQQSEQYRKQVFEGSHIPMVVLDLHDIVFLDMNEAAVQQYGYHSKQELIGESPLKVSVKEKGKDINDKSPLGEMTRQVMKNGEVTFEWNHQRPNGEVWLAKIHLISFDTEEGRLIQGTIEDITEQKQQEEEREQLKRQLEFSQRMESIGRLAGGIAHDFNNLLTVINGYSELLLGKKSTDPALSKTLMLIRNAGVRAAELTSQLLNFSRPQTTQHIPLNLGMTIKDSNEMLRSILGEDIRLQLDIKDTDLHVLADPGQIQQVFLNLIVNAKDAMSDGGKLKISTALCIITPATANTLNITPGDYIELKVTDSGTGMDEEVSKHIFEPFFTTKKSGTGFGLSTVYGIIRQSKGAIQVSSEISKGTSFTVLLPKTDREMTPQEKNEITTQSASGSFTILVVEDEQEILDYAETVLQSEGFKVLTCPSGNDALTLMETLKEPVHLLLTDVVMEGIKGGELAEIFSQKYPDTSVLFMSGYPADSLAMHGIKQGTRQLLAKPFSPKQLLEKVHQILNDSLASN